MTGEFRDDHHIPKRSLKYAIGLTAIIFLVEVVGGLLSGSLSLISDAAHMFQDVIALLLSLGAITIAERLPTPSRTFGYHRVEIGAAVANGLLLILVSGIIAWEALSRFSNPQPIDSMVMLVVAVIGLVANLVVAYLLHGTHDLNVKSAFFHVLGDVLSSVAVIGAGIWIALTGQTFIDPLLGILIAGFILFSSFSLLRDSSGILLQFAPRDVDIGEVIREIASVPGVEGVHNMHLWTLCSNIHVLDTHIYSCETDVTRIEQMKMEIKQRLGKFRVKHSTLEFECRKCENCDMVRHIRD